MDGPASFAYPSHMSGPKPQRSTALLLLVLAGVVVPVALLAAAVAARAWVVEMMRVPQWGMFPTYRAGDRLLSSKWRPSAGRGDVILFETAERASVVFIQRVIAGNGDVLEVRDGRPFVNGWQVPSCVVGADGYTDESGARHDGILEVEFLDQRAYLVFYETRKGESPPPVVLRSKPGEWLVLGDNRRNSFDSRGFRRDQGGVVQSLRARPWNEAELRVPESLKGALAECLSSKRPAVATPPLSSGPS